MRSRWLFLAAYACSGLAGLIYQMSWTRLLTLYMGHTVAAASTVVAAFMGGLGGGAILGARLIPRLTPRQSLYTYALLEAIVLVAALLLPVELAALTPILNWSYRDGAPGFLFPAIRLLLCLLLVLIPALALGATFPAAVRWFVKSSQHPGRGAASAKASARLDQAAEPRSRAGELYAANTIGAALGVLAAGFVLIPTLGISGTTLVGVAASSLAIVAVLVVARHSLPALPARDDEEFVGAGLQTRPSRRSVRDGLKTIPYTDRRWVAAAVLGLSGFATLTSEIAWTRALSLIVGPTTYAFAATLAAMIGGTAIGSVAGAWLAGRVRQPSLWLAMALAGSAIANTWASSLAGDYVPRVVAEQLARSSVQTGSLLAGQASLVAMLILPAAIGLGIAFPLALEIAGGSARHLGIVYGINTLAGVAGSLMAGFVLIPLFGLPNTLRVVSGLLAGGGLIAALWGTQSRRPLGALAAPATASGVAIAFLIWAPPWDQELLASGVYKYASQVRANSGVETADLLKAGTLLYYREGAASTVSVKRLAGTTSLSIDGKVDASSSGDMLTQKLLAHLPLLLHPNPENVLVIGLGSGVTVASALIHPIARVDVVEISPQVVEASQYFADWTHSPLTDPRARLIVGDGRSHLLLSRRMYDVIISEPSNPWMAGVAALFTREFFTAARSRLAPGGVICQWAHTYDISESDLQSIVGTFLSVFPNGTAWLVGEADLLLVASERPLDAQLDGLGRAWARPGVAVDLRERAVQEPFALWSLFVAGPQELQRYAGAATHQTDDRMMLEFSGPRAMYGAGSRDNAVQLRQLLNDGRTVPAVVRHAKETAGAAQWRDRGAMMLKVEDFESAYQDFSRALALSSGDRADATVLEGLVRSAVATHREADALGRLKAAIAAHPNSTAPRIATSKLLAAGGSFDAAIEGATEAWKISPRESSALEQVASIFSDLGDAERLDQVLGALRQLQPIAPRLNYYEASSRFLHGQLPDALRLAQRAVEQTPDAAAAWNLLGAIHASAGRTAEARAAFEAALRLNPLDAATYTNLGLLELEASNRSGAARYFAEALSVEPESQAAMEGLARSR